MIEIGSMIYEYIDISFQVCLLKKLASILNDYIFNLAPSTATVPFVLRIGASG